MTTILPIASGKGGVGKTLFTTNLGVALASMGKTVVLIDLDLGGSNLHTCLGIKNMHRGIGNLIYKQEPNLQALLVDTEIKRLHFVPGDSLLPGTANLNFFVKQKIIRGIEKLMADYILLDLGSGTSYDTLDFFLISSAGIVVTIPETTAILNAYSFLKSSIFRMLYRSFRPRSPARQIIRYYLTQRMEGTERSVADLIETLSQDSAESGVIAKQQLMAFLPRVVVNITKGRNDQILGSRLGEIVSRNLNFDLEYLGFLDQDSNVPNSVLQRKPLFLTNRTSPYCRSIDQIVYKLINKNRAANSPSLFDLDDEQPTIT